MLENRRPTTVQDSSSVGVRLVLFDLKRTKTLVRFLKSLGKKVHIQFLSSTFLSVLILAFLAQPRRINLELFNISRPSTF